MPIIVTTEQRRLPAGTVDATVTVPATVATVTALPPSAITVSSVSVDAVPIAASVAGRAPSSISASAAIVAARITATLAAFPASVGQQVGWVGDSLTYQDGTGQANIKTLLVANGWANTTDTRVDGLIGRSIINGVAPYIPSSQDVINTWRAGGFNPRTWVIALITNDEWDTDPNWTTKVNTLLDLIVSVPHASGLPYRVFWVGGPIYRADVAAANAPTYANRATRFAAVMASIRTARLAAGQIGEMTYIDFPALYRNGRDETGHWQAGDATGRHMTPTGYGVRNGLTVPLVTLPTSGTFPGSTTFPGPDTFPGG